MMTKPTTINKKSKSLSIYLSVLFGLSLLVLSSCSDSNLGVEDLRVDYQSNPLGVDASQPHFSWKIKSEERGVYQASWRVVVGESLQEVKQKGGSVWDSGEINSSETVNIAYDGPSLKSNQKYFWRVEITTENQEKIWSEPASFHTGLLDSSEWTAHWITTNEEIIHASPLFRKEFSIDKKVKQAYAFVTACGFYEFFLNGEKVGDHVLDPAVTDYRHRILYATFDLTGLLKRGGNALGVMLGNGAYNLRQTEGRYSWGDGGTQLGNPAFIVQVNITYEDGSQAVIVSDESWNYADGPITFNNIYGGEDYDARNEADGWSSVGFSDDNWRKASLAEPPGGQLKSQSMPAIKVTETLEPIAETNPADGVLLYDLGQNIAGWWRVQLKGKAGQTIRIRGAETLNDSLFPKNLEEGDRLSEKHRYHAETWTDYTLKGGGTETYEPRFFYTGFRYIEVATGNQEDLEILKVEGRVVGSALERNGRFVSSDSLLNQIHRAGLWSQKGNLVGYPTDCPHREKGAYNGDGQVIAETSMHDFQMAPFYYKWLNDMRDSQEPNGRIPNTSPTLIGGMGGGVAWGSAYVLIPYWMHHYYNDTRILTAHYPAMKRYLQYLQNLAKTDSKPEEPFIINDFDGYWYSLGEWCAPGERDGPNHAVVNTFYYYYNAKLMAEMANILGHTNDAREFSDLSDTVRNAFNSRFFNPETFLYGTDSTYQTYQLLALHGGLVPAEHRESVLQTIVDDIERRDGHLHTGIIGTKYLWPVLTTNGYRDLAFATATKKTYPSYGYWLDNNATTLLEEWSGDNSHNHQMFGSVVEYFYKYLAGIQSPMEGETTKGYRQILLKPNVPVGLDKVDASLETVAGTLVSNWAKDEHSFRYTVSVPANSSATVAIPAFNFEQAKVTEGNSLIWDNGGFVSGVAGIRNVTRMGDEIRVEIESGQYDFRLTQQQ
jgi:alpha-L-rhamnosidase